MNNNNNLLPLFNIENLKRHMDKEYKLSKEEREMAIALVNQFDGDVVELIKVAKKLTN